MVRQVLGIWAAITVPLVALLLLGAAYCGQPASRFTPADMLGLGALAVAGMALVCEYVDSTLGMGYGTALTPLLMLVGFKAGDVVPAVLISELATGLMAALLHHRAGNVDLGRSSPDTKVAVVLGSCSVVGAVAAVVVALNIPKAWLNFYIGALVLAMGVLILVYRNVARPFSWTRLVGLGVLASFNKGMSGGGYGPVITCGQILSGVSGKRAVGVTSLAEALTCIVGVVGFAVAKREWPLWPLVVPMVIGALCSTPLSAWSVSRMGVRRLTLVIGITTLVLGGLSLYKAFRG